MLVVVVTELLPAESAAVAVLNKFLAARGLATRLETGLAALLLHLLFE